MNNSNIESSVFWFLSTCIQNRRKMFSKRGTLSFVLLASVALALIASTEAANLIIGTVGPRDHLAQREFLKKPSKWMQVITADKTFTTTSGETISQVRLLDQNKKGNGATASVTAGGPGFKYVSVHFKSKRGHSIDFAAELYGQ
ncbi:probable salivary secreted peptide [Phymastichus coffea]|uniref:probable salivary secreted peptide n=1 Tax=Phymastichus coffea TaxID=108790 RepID=UPI00273A9F19|nr:probable salivary secreted peptide [Phymastichus coffea]